MPGPPRRSPPCPSTGPPVAVHDTATGRTGRDRARRTGAALRLRHHAVRRHPPRPRRDVRRLRPAQPGLAQRRPRGHLRPERHRRRRPAARAGRQGARSTGSSSPSARPSCSARTWRRCGCCRRPTTSAPSSRSRWSIELIERLQARRRGLPRRRRPLLLRDRRPGVRRGVRLRPRDDAASSSPSAAATPTARARRTRSTAWSGAASARASRPGTARSAPAGPAGTSSAPRSRCATSAPTSTSRAAAATWSSRTTRCAPATPRSPIPASPFAQAYVHAGMVGYDGEKMSKSQGNLVFVSALRNSDVDPMAIRLALLRHHYRTDWEWTDAELWDAVDDLARWRKARRARCRRRRPARWSRRCSPPGRRPRRPARDGGRRPLGRRHPRHRRARRHQRPRRRGDDARRARRRAGPRALALRLPFVQDRPGRAAAR